MKYLFWPAAGLLAGSLLSLTAAAADPASGTLSLENQTLEFGAGPFFSVNPTPLAANADGGYECLNPALQCDHYALTIDLPQDIAEAFPAAVVRMVFVWDDPLGTGAEDYDIYLVDADGALVNSATSFEQPEVMVQLAQGGVQELRIDIVPFSTVGSSYEGVVELSLGEPAAGVDPDEYLGGLALKPARVEPAAAATAPTTGAGAGGWLLCALLGLGGRGRRTRR